MKVINVPSTVRVIPLVAHKYGAHCGIADGLYVLFVAGEHLHWLSWLVLVMCFVDILFYKEGAA